MIEFFTTDGSWWKSQWSRDEWEKALKSWPNVYAYRGSDPEPLIGDTLWTIPSVHVLAWKVIDEV